VKTKLKYVGNFIELGYDDHPNPPSLVALRGKRAPANKQQVVEYLRSATTLVMSPGRDEDVLDPSKSAGSASVMTDGTLRVAQDARSLRRYIRRRAATRVRGPHGAQSLEGAACAGQARPRVARVFELTIPGD